MPFKSDRQRKWMFKNEPSIAERWAREQKAKGQPIVIKKKKKKSKKRS
jgi:hypothetical protein